jgi:hypothetical protein
MRVVVSAAILVGGAMWMWDVFRTQPPPAVGDAPTAGPVRHTGAGVNAAPVGAASTAAAVDRVPITTTGPAVLRGTIRIAETKAGVRGGSIDAKFIDCAAAAIDPASLAARNPEELSEQCEERRIAVAEGGTYQFELPQHAFLAGIAIEPPDTVEAPPRAERVRFHAFERREVVVREVIVGAKWRRDFEVGLGARLTGLVVDRATGAPVLAALVSCVSSASLPDANAAFSAADGTFEIAGLGPSAPQEEPWQVHASCVGFQERTLTVRPETPAPTQVTIALDKAVVVRGRVVDPRGRGVPSVDVHAVGLGRETAPFGQSLEFVQWTTTDANGAFALSVATAGSVSLRAEGNYLESEPDGWAFGAGVLAGVVATADVHDLRLELKPMASFHVRAVGPDGTAVRDQDLTVLVRTADGWRRTSAGFQAAPGIEHEISVCALAPTGSAAPVAGRAVALRGGTTCLALHREAGVVEVPVSLAATEFDLPPARAAKAEGELLTSSEHDVRGPHACFVRDVTFLDAATGERLRGLLYEIRSDGGMSAGTTSSFGRMRLKLAPGLVDLTISVDGYRPLSIRVDNPATGYEEVDLRFRR